MLAGESTAQSTPNRNLELGVDGTMMAAFVNARGTTLYSATTLRIGRSLGATSFALEARLTPNDRWVANDREASLSSGLNLLWQQNPVVRDRLALRAYATTGFGVGFREADGSTAHAYSVNIGAGIRKPWRSIAIRAELSLARDFGVGKSGDPGFAPARTRAGVRIGLSVWP
jgi:hypothetical protein